MMSAKPVVFVVRLTAIGDTLITARALAQLQTAGYEPVLVTSQAQVAIAEALTPVKYYILQNSNGELNLINKEANGTAADWQHLFYKSASEKMPPIPLLDLQNTARSRRAIAGLKKRIAPRGVKVHRVPKHTLFRIFLMIAAFFTFSQKPKRTLFVRGKVKTIHEIQRVFVHHFIQQEMQQTRISNSTLSPQPESSTVRVTTGMQKVARVLQCKALEEARLTQFAGKKYIAVFPGASGPLKTWPKENYRACLEYLLQESELEIVVCGGSAEADVACYLAFSHPSRIHNLAGHASLEQTLSLIAHAQHVLTGDSFATHAADLAGVSATVLFGGTSPLFGFVPLSSKIEVRYENLSCSPCTRHGKGDCRFKNLKCLAGIEGVAIGQKIHASL